MLPLQMLFFEDLSVGMTETVKKTINSSDVIGFAEVTGDHSGMGRLKILEFI